MKIKSKKKKIKAQSYRSTSRLVNGMQFGQNDKQNYFL